MLCVTYKTNTNVCGVTVTMVELKADSTTTEHAGGLFRVVQCYTVTRLMSLSHFTICYPTTMWILLSQHDNHF